MKIFGSRSYVSLSPAAQQLERIVVVVVIVVGAKLNYLWCCGF